MDQSIPANEFHAVSSHSIADVKPVSIHDFIDQDLVFPDRPVMRRTCLANDRRYEPPQSQVDRLISDLMDIIVKSASSEAGDAPPPAGDAVAEVVALSMMQALLQKQVCSSF
jgi:hypothetical protein